MGRVSWGQGHSYGQPPQATALGKLCACLWARSAGPCQREENLACQAPSHIENRHCEVGSDRPIAKQQYLCAGLRTGHWVFVGF
jgi:hypothetical protein